MLGVGLGVAGCIGLILILAGIAVIFYALNVYNGLIQLKNQIEKSWANIDVLLKQRNDELPNLVETCKGYMKYEKGVLEEVTKLRTAIMSATGPKEKAKASEQLSGALKTLFAVAENYPNLKSSAMSFPTRASNKSILLQESEEH